MPPARQAAIIYAACEKLAHRKPRFTVEEITITVWRQHPSMFGMKGFEDQHPDLRKVVSLLAGKSRGMVHRGQLRKAGKGLYSLGTKPPDIPVAVGRGGANQDLCFVRQLMTKAAAVKMIDSAAAITKLDAMEFFGLKRFAVLNDELCNKTIRRLDEIEMTGKVEDADVKFLRNVAVYLRDRFCKVKS